MLTLVSGSLNLSVEAAQARRGGEEVVHLTRERCKRDTSLSLL